MIKHKQTIENDYQNIISYAELVELVPGSSRYFLQGGANQTPQHSSSMMKFGILRYD